ncbi:hypothetical protein L7F22_017347 [Adiantum nelumboides]|nr:hypothetical protein [Adiantum nelumboides]
MAGQGQDTTGGGGGRGQDKIFREQFYSSSSSRYYQLLLRSLGIRFVLPIQAIDQTSAIALAETGEGRSRLTVEACLCENDGDLYSERAALMPAYLPSSNLCENQHRYALPNLAPSMEHKMERTVHKKTTDKLKGFLKSCQSWKAMGAYRRMRDHEKTEMWEPTLVTYLHSMELTGPQVWVARKGGGWVPRKLKKSSKALEHLISHEDALIMSIRCNCYYSGLIGSDPWESSSGREQRSPSRKFRSKAFNRRYIPHDLHLTFKSSSFSTF